MLNRCIICGSNFESDEKLDACSEECKTMLDRGEFHDGRLTVICMECGKEIKTTYYRIRNGHNKTCSKECQFTAQSKRMKGPGSPQWKGGNIEMTCLECGVKFESSRSRVINEGRGKFCSKKCFGAWYKKHGKKGEERSTYIPRVKTVCAQCGVELIRTQHSIDIYKKSFCSTKCQGTWFGEHCKGENHPVFKNVINYHGYHHTFIQKHNQARVRNFFKNTCIMCGKVHGENDEDAIIHHIYPEERTLPFEETKYVCVCRPCHAKLHHDKNEWDYWTPYFIELIENYMGGVCFI